MKTKSFAKKTVGLLGVALGLGVLSFFEPSRIVVVLPFLALLPGWLWVRALAKESLREGAGWAHAFLLSGVLVSFSAYALRTFVFEEMSNSLIILAALFPIGIGVILNLIVGLKNHGRK